MMFIYLYNYHCITLQNNNMYIDRKEIIYPRIFFFAETVNKNQRYLKTKENILIIINMR